MQEPVHFEAKCMPGGGRLVINEEDVTDKVKGFQVSAAEGEMPILTVWGKPELGSVVGTAYLSVMTRGPDWQTVLGTIEPAWLSQQALEREEFGGKTFVENVLDLIKERFSAAEA